jgi:hypothetical protein
MDNELKRILKKSALLHGVLLNQVKHRQNFTFLLILLSLLVCVLGQFPCSQQWINGASFWRYMSQDTSAHVRNK